MSVYYKDPTAESGVANAVRDEKIEEFLRDIRYVCKIHRLSIDGYIKIIVNKKTGRYVKRNVFEKKGDK